MTTKDDDTVDHGRRRFLVKATSALGGVGLIGACVPFVASMLPNEAAKAAGAPVEVDVGDLQPGQQRTVIWRGRPIWIIRRTPEMIAELSSLDSELRDPNSTVDQQPAYADNEYRSRKPEYLVLVGICTHLGCSPTYRPDKGSIDTDWKGGFYCPCHGSKFDLAGRVFKDVPAPINLEVPPYTFLSDTKILIGTNSSPTETA